MPSKDTFSPAARRVLEALRAWEGGLAGWTRITSATLVARVGLSRRSVWYGLGELEAARIIERRGTRGAGGATELRWRRIHCAGARANTATPGRVNVQPPSLEPQGLGGHRERGNVQTAAESAQGPGRVNVQAPSLEPQGLEGRPGHGNVQGAGVDGPDAGGVGIVQTAGAAEADKTRSVHAIPGVRPKAVTLFAAAEPGRPRDDAGSSSVGQHHAAAPADAELPYASRMPGERFANVSAFCEMMGLSTREAVDGAKVFARIGRLERLYGVGYVAEALMVADLKHTETAFDSPEAAFRYVTATARSMRDRDAAARAKDGPAPAPQVAVPQPVRTADLSGGNHGAFLIDQEWLHKEVRRRLAERAAAREQQ